MRAPLTLLIALAALPAFAQSNGTYNTTTTTTNTTTTSSTGNYTTSGNTVVTGSGHSGIYTTHHSGSSGGTGSNGWSGGSGQNHSGYHAGNAADQTARDFPYDSTNGRNRSDIDTPRKGFDDPRNPWDGRYSNDNPANYGAPDNTGAGNTPQLGAGSDYTPGHFGTRSVSGGYSYGGYHH